MFVGAAGPRALPARGRARRSPRPWPCAPWPRSPAARSPACSSPPTWCPATSSAPGSGGRPRRRFDIELGPVFATVVLADEINRAPAKVQSALLEAMAERQVSLGGASHPLPDAVPGAGHPEPDRVRRASTSCRRPSATGSCSRSTSATRPATEELTILARMSVDPPSPAPVLTPERVLALQRRPTGCSCTTPAPSTPCGWCWPPATRPRYGLPDLAAAAAVRRQPAGHARPGRGGPGAGPAARARLRAARRRRRRGRRRDRAPAGARLRRAGRRRRPAVAGAPGARRGAAAAGRARPGRRPDAVDRPREHGPAPAATRPVTAGGRPDRPIGRGRAGAARRWSSPSGAGSTACCRASTPGLRPGPGGEPDAARPYLPGQDDVRRMDWAVTARTGDAARPRHDRRARAGDLGAGRRLGEHGLRHRA